jgi:hypothetical protein
MCPHHRIGTDILGRRSLKTHLTPKAQSHIKDYRAIVMYFTTDPPQFIHSEKFDG